MSRMYQSNKMGKKTNEINIVGGRRMIVLIFVIAVATLYLIVVNIWKEVNKEEDENDKQFNSDNS